MNEIELLRLKAAARRRAAESQSGPVGLAPQTRQGIIEGVTGMASMPAYAGEWLAEKATGAIDKYVLGRSDDEIQASRKAYENWRSPIDPIRVMESINQSTGIREPRNRPEQFAKTIGSFLPSALAGGGDIVPKVIQAGVAGAASEGAGQLTHDKKIGGIDVEPVSRIAGALIGAKVAGPSPKAPLREMVKSAPSMDDVKAATKQAYGALDDAKIVFDPKAYKSTAMKIQADLRKHGLLAEDTGEIASTLKDIVSRAGKINGWTEIDSIRKRLGTIAGDAKPENATQAARANIIRSHLDDLVNGGDVISLRGVPRDQIKPMVEKARELARRGIIAKNIDRMGQKLPGYLSGDESGYRNQFGSYLKSDKGARLTPTEKKAFAKVVRREGPLNFAHMMGSRWGQIAGGSSLTGAGALAGSSFGPMGTVAGALLGPVANYAATSGFRKFMDVTTDKQVKKAMATVLAGKGAQSVASAAAKKATREEIARALLLSGAAHRAGQ